MSLDAANPVNPQTMSIKPSSISHEIDNQRNTSYVMPSNPNARCFDTPLAIHPTASVRPHPYPPQLTSVTSPMCPHVPAMERLKLWKPFQPRDNRDAKGNPTAISDNDINRIKEVMARAWQDSTLSNYGSGLLVYHVFCDDRKIPKDQHAPAAPILINSFIVTLAGGYTGDAISNYVCRVRTWLLLHGLPWLISEKKTQTLLEAASKTTPPSLKRKKQKLCTPDFILAIRNQLNLNDGADAVVYACLTTAFYTAAHLGEFTVKNLKAFDPTLHVKHTDIRIDTDQNGLKSTVFHLPSTKMAPSTGEDVSWSKQLGATDPEAALHHHLLINDPLLNTHIFAYQFKKMHHPLTKPEFLK